MNAPPHIRPATFADAGKIGLVHRRNGISESDAETRRRLWDSYPFAAEFRDIPIGWVLETGAGEIVGTIGSIHMLYEMGGRRIRAAIAADWAVDAVHRGMALHLVTAFFKQKSADLLIDGSASPTASKVLTGLRIPRIPVPDYSSPCFWAANARAFAKAALRRRGVFAESALAWPVGLILLVRDILRRSGRGKLSTPVGRIHKFDERFDALWGRITAGPPRLRAVRTQAVLEWKFGAGLAAGRAVALAAGSGGNLTGYIVLTRRPDHDLGMSLYDVADFQAAGDDPAVFRDLLLAAVQLAHEEGVDAVKLLTGTPAKRNPALALRPYSYQLPFWQLYYRAAPDLKNALGSADAWDFSPFDTY